MKKRIVSSILSFILFILFMNQINANTFSITLIDGKKYSGEIINSHISLEWRKDIYEITNEQGIKEKFFLKPELKGKFSFNNISQINRINPSTAPARYATLENDKKVRLVQNYMIRFRNKKVLYISDFVTLTSHTLKLSTSTGIKKIHLSQIRYLVRQGQTVIKQTKQSEKKKTTATTKKRSIIPAWIKGNEKKYLKKSIKTEANEATVNPNYISFLIVLSILLFLILIFLVYLLIRSKQGYQKKSTRTKKLKKKKPVKETQHTKREKTKKVKKVPNKKRSRTGPSKKTKPSPKKKNRKK